MKSYDAALYDGSDPLYAPGLSWSKPTNARWKAPKRYVKAGYDMKSCPLPGRQGDDRDEERAKLCRKYTRDMLAWFETQEPIVDQETWNYIFIRYETDDISPMREVKANTRKGYEEQLAKLRRAMGHTKIQNTTYETFMGMKKAMQEKGRSDSYIRRLFTQLRMVCTYGAVLGREDIAKVKAVLSEMRFKSTPSRSQAMTREQVEMVVAAAEAKGMHSFALGLYMQFELSVRAVDIRGQWVEEDGEAGITHNGKRWVDGLTWDMIDPDMSTITKVISKTRNSLPEAYVFNIALLPHIQERLHRIAVSGRIGPVIVSERSGRPYTTQSWSQAFRRFKRDLGLPESLWMMDARAGGITEAQKVVSDPVDLRNAAQHKSLATTDKYMRDRSASANKVIKMRNKRSTY